MAWHQVDAAIREKNKRLTANQQGEDDGGAWLSSKAAQRMSLAGPETAHCRTIISKFGGTIKVGTAVSMPAQTWNNNKPLEYALELFQQSLPRPCFRLTHTHA